MNEQQPAERSLAPSSAANTHPSAPIVASQADRRGMVIIGGLLAGLGLSLAVAFLMHVVQEVSPNGYGISISGSVVLEVIVAGPIFGLGLAMAITALMPPASTGGPSASASPTNPADHVPDA